MTDQTLSDDVMREVHSLVLLCLDAADPEDELSRRTVERTHLRPIVRQIMERAASRATERDAATEPEQIGPYHIVRQLGVGGMGTVYLAEQKEPIARPVALKLIKLGMDTDEVLRRFEFERQTLALMNHDNIARVFDAGRTSRGQPYFAMEYVPGVPLTKFADQHTLTVAARLALMLQVCAGVQHAHQRGVVHRDLKPANILVVEQDGRGVPKIIDFGLARATEQRRRDVTQLTSEGSALGTPAYMSPEQTGMTDDAVDTRSDVYALGVIMYELLTGELPFSHEELVARGQIEMLRMIRDIEPPRPSRKLALRGAGDDAARLRATSVIALTRILQRDLDWIVMLALRKEREQRYASVGELAADIQRFINDEPVSATAPSTVYRVGKLLRRYRVQAIAAAVVLLCLVAGLVVSLVFFFDAERAHGQTKFERQRQDPMILMALRQDGDNLWPIHPAQVERMQRWLERVDELRQNTPAQKAYLVALQAEAAQTVASGTQPSPKLQEQIREQRAFLDGVAALGADAGSSWLDNTVAGVAARAAAARTLAARTIDAHRAAWHEARAAIKASDGNRASSLYRGLDLPDQLGLVPLGPDPKSKLWEFVHVDSGEADAPLPSRDSDGYVVMRSETGFVFVLVPGGTFTMGADKEHDADAEPDEAPPHAVSVAPYFLSKFECTQAQWRRMTGSVPSQFNPAAKQPPGAPDISWTNPVESILWADVVAMCGRHRLTLPTEAQWEYACRAGSQTRYVSDDVGDALQHEENIADSFLPQYRADWAKLEPWLDRQLVHAPTGTFRANPFGLHDIQGNVSEMCLDLDLPYVYPARPGDGLREAPPESKAGRTTIRVRRGGCWYFARLHSRSADRDEVPPTIPTNLIGFRPARPLRGPAE